MQEYEGYKKSVFSSALFFDLFIYYQTQKEKLKQVKT